MHARAALRDSLQLFGLNRELSAAFVGVSINTFDAMVKDGRMPKARRIGARKVWPRPLLEAAVLALPEDVEDEAVNDWDADAEA